MLGGHQKLKDPKTPHVNFFQQEAKRKVKTGWERQEEKGMVEDGSGEGILCEKVVCENV